MDNVKALMRNLIAALLAFASTQALASATNVNLGAAGAFGVLAGTTVTSIGPTEIHGDLGLWPGSEVTGFPPGLVVDGAWHVSDITAEQAQSDLVSAFVFAAGESCGSNLTGQDLGGLTLSPGVYCFGTSALLTGTLTLDAGNDPSAVFVFQIADQLDAASGSSVEFLNGGKGDAVFWKVGSSATLGTGSAFAGSILALTSITLDTDASIHCGRALARNGAVTLQSNIVSIYGAGCGSPGDTQVPEPGSALLIGMALASLAVLKAKRLSAQVRPSALAC